MALFTPARRGIVAQVGAPVRRYLATEAGSAGLLLAATVLAVIWANVPAGYASFWRTPVAIRVGDAELVLDARHWVNDGLMALFFLVVGLEVVRELVLGELTDRRRVAVPVVAALAGMAVPALVFLAVVPAGPAAHAWGVVISSDTAFVLGALALIAPGARVRCACSCCTHLARVARHGTVRAAARGEVLFLREEVRALVVVRSGAVAVVQDPARLVAVVVRPGEIVVVAGERLPRLLDEDPALADILARSYLLRWSPAG